MRQAMRTVDAAYRWSASESTWLEGVVAAAESFGVGRGILGYAVDLQNGPRVESLARTHDTPEDSTSTVVSFTESLTPELAHAMYAPTEFPGNAHFRWARLTRDARFGQSAVERSSAHRLPPMWALICGNPTRRVVALGFLAKAGVAPDTAFPSRNHARQLGLIGAHIGAALRLRGGLTEPSADDPATEAVLTPGGQVLHATGPAVAARRRLAEAVVQSEKSRSRHVSDDDALSMWRALVAGRWSIVDIAERDGKRLLLARRNEVDAKSDLLSLTELERDVTWLAALGHSYKYIGYELGVHSSTVVRRLDSAMRKLNLSSRQELLRAFASRGEPGSRRPQRKPR